MPIPLSVEVIVVWLCAYPLKERLILCGFVPCLLYRGGCCWRKELCTPKFVIVIPRWSLCGRSCVKILLCEGGDVE